MDHPHALAIVVIATSIVSFHVSLLGSLLIDLDVFLFWWIVDVVVVVVKAFHEFISIECLADVARHDSALPCFRAFSEAKRIQVK